MKNTLTPEQNSPAPSNAISSTRRQPSVLRRLGMDRRLELALVLVFLATLCGIRINMGHDLYRIKAFDQYNIFFDADPIQYVIALSDGWGFGRTVHPGFGLMFNLPIRALAFVLDAIGFAPNLDQAAIRVHLALAVAPICSAISGYIDKLTHRYLYLCACSILIGITTIGVALNISKVLIHL